MTTTEAALRDALEKIDRQVSHGKMGDWSIALTAIREIARSALSQPPASSTAQEDETAWLIERNDIATVESGNKIALHYYAEWPTGKHYWTPDHMKARRFAGEVAARAETNGDPTLTVAEHMWLPPHRPAQDQGEGDHG